MNSPVHGTVGALEWGVASQAYPGETSSGDSWLVKELPEGILVAVVDALGHGGEAAPAAQKVADVLVAARIEGILNFAPVTLNLPKQVQTIGVDLAIELEQLAFAVANPLPRT